MFYENLKATKKNGSRICEPIIVVMRGRGLSRRSFPFAPTKPSVLCPFVPLTQSDTGRPKTSPRPPLVFKSFHKIKSQTLLWCLRFY
ncbi:MAG: hypothetical protein UT08_C0024G0002 [Candidatus Woesebacteria bacterium GW2011_GWB1_38_8]|uniref:Uncharacterized protein n=1 Tax=Candidatus Woesebacteria bacterium GW2011_GWB1_38_8 TaxID=1618570 RepID=A0A0G0L7Z5_9BACT|nr:MAG: hypothetical protein UT08_C0024G0002 [Candidatus Woesebacteria bacterium GW2011_GWB1_38_8]